MRVAVIGAGWTGLTAAVVAAERGAAVTLFEAGRLAGGRARMVADDEFSFLDNGQHILIAAYRSVWALLARLGVAREWVCLRQPLRWHLYDGVQFGLRGRMYYPFDLLNAILSAQGVRLPEKMDLLRQMAMLYRWHGWGRGDDSVANWLNGHHVSQKWRVEFWQPLVWGAMNTPLEMASVRVLANVLADGVWSGACDVYVPRVDLGAMLVVPALQRLQGWGGQFVPETRVQRLRDENGKIWVEGERFDRVIVAVAPYHVQALLPEPDVAAFQAAANTWTYHAITTVYLKYAQPTCLPNVMTGLAYGTAQWLIDRSHLTGTNELAAVISCSHLFDYSTREWAARVHEDIVRIAPHLSEPLARRVITEKRATIAATPNRCIPNQEYLNRKGIFLAGDYLNPRYPATLETAVQSGFQAASAAVGI